MRVRIALTVAMLALLVILAQAGALFVMFEEMEEEFIDDTLNQQLMHSIEVWRNSPQLAHPNTPDMKLYRIAQESGTPAVPEHLARLPVGNHEIQHDGREFHVAVREGDGARFILLYDVAEHEARMEGMRAIIITGALFVAFAVMAAVYGLAGRLTRRLERLALQVGGREHHGGYAQPDMEREILAVARALDAHEARHAALLVRERDFTANLSHELRTPLTAIRTDAELIAALPGLPDAAQRRAARIIEGADQIAGLAESLLVLARETQSGLSEEVHLESALREAWAALAAQHGKTAHLRMDVAKNKVLVTDPSLLSLVLRNLFENALRHACAGEISCRLEGSTLHVRDDGPGFAPEELPRVFERFFRHAGSGGQGLGLALVRHVCTACGWEVRAANAPEGGAQISIDFGGALPPH